MKHLTVVINLLRPHQWLKNLLLLFPPFLGGTLLQMSSLSSLVLPLISFSAGASSIYIVNDLMDMKQDVHHPQKSRRPLPAGKINPPAALFLALMTGFAAVVCGFLVSPVFLLYLLIYLAISVAYSLHLKTIPVVEIFCVVSGFYSVCKPVAALMM